MCWGKGKGGGGGGEGGGVGNENEQALVVTTLESSGKSCLWSVARSRTCRLVSHGKKKRHCNKVNVLFVFPVSLLEAGGSKQPETDWKMSWTKKLTGGPTTTTQSMHERVKGEGKGNERHSKHSWKAHARANTNTQTHKQKQTRTNKHAQTNTQARTIAWLVGGSKRNCSFKEVTRNKSLDIQNLWRGRCLRRAHKRRQDGSNIKQNQGCLLTDGRGGFLCQRLGGLGG